MLLDYPMHFFSLFFIPTWFVHILNRISVPTINFQNVFVFGILKWFSCVFSVFWHKCIKSILITATTSSQTDACFECWTESHSEKEYYYCYVSPCAVFLSIWMKQNKINKSKYDLCITNSPNDVKNGTHCTFWQSENLH